MIQIGFASSNPHKLLETQQCFEALSADVSIVSLPFKTDVAETGDTFCDNALIKLEAALKQGIPSELDFVLAEDSGLIISALDGVEGLSPFPGIYSDRWLMADYSIKNEAILKLMAGKTNRDAYYEACIACWSKASQKISYYTGTVKLRVAETPQGENGFGYDPIMIPIDTGLDTCMAELSAAEKNKISHRFNALNHFWSANDPATIKTSGCF